MNDSYKCNVCGGNGITWSATEGGRCNIHSSYTLPKDAKDWPKEYARRANMDGYLAAVGGNPWMLTGYMKLIKKAAIKAKIEDSRKELYALENN